MDQLTEEYEARERGDSEHQRQALAKIGEILQAVHVDGGEVAPDDLAELVQLMDMVGWKPDRITTCLAALAEVEAHEGDADDPDDLAEQIAAAEGRLQDGNNRSQDGTVGPVGRAQGKLDEETARQEVQALQARQTALLAWKHRLAEHQANYPYLFSLAEAV